MKQFMSVILAVVLVVAVGASLANGTFAGFLDTEISTDNYMCAGTRTIELDGGPIEVTHGMPCEWYSEEFTLTNTGTLDGEVSLHIYDEDGSLDYNGSVSWKGIQCIEAGDVNGLVYDGLNADYVPGSPVGAQYASSESEFVSEEGGQVGQITVAGLGTDAGSDDGPAEWLMSKHIGVKIWFDKDGSGEFERNNSEGEDELILEDKLFNLICEDITLGVIPGRMVEDDGKGGGWASYFEYEVCTDVEIPLIAGKAEGMVRVGSVYISCDGDSITVTYDTSPGSWDMDETHLYVGTEPPPKLAPGSFPYKHEDLGDETYYDEYIIPFGEIGVGPGDIVYIAAHAANEWDTAWAKGVSRRFKIELHLQQLEDPLGTRDYDLDEDIDDDDAQKRFWPTNVFQGDKCIFDMVFWFVKP